MQGRRAKIQIHVITKKRVKDVEKHTTHSNTYILTIKQHDIHAIYLKSITRRKNADVYH